MLGEGVKNVKYQKQPQGGMCRLGTIMCRSMLQAHIKRYIP